MVEIGGPGGPWPPLNLKPLHRNVIFAIENHFSLAKWPPLLSVASSTSVQETSPQMITLGIDQLLQGL